MLNSSSQTLACSLAGRLVTLITASLEKNAMPFIVQLHQYPRLVTFRHLNITGVNHTPLLESCRFQWVSGIV